MSKRASLASRTKQAHRATPAAVRISSIWKEKLGSTKKFLLYAASYPRTVEKAVRPQPVGLLEPPIGKVCLKTESHHSDIDNEHSPIAFVGHSPHASLLSEIRRVCVAEPLLNQPLDILRNLRFIPHKTIENFVDGKEKRYEILSRAWIRGAKDDFHPAVGN